MQIYLKFPVERPLNFCVEKIRSLFLGQFRFSLDLMYPDVVIIHRSKRLVVYGTQYEDRIAIAHNSVETTLHAHLTSGCLVVTRVRCPPKPLRQDSNSLSDPHMASQDARITER